MRHSAFLASVLASTLAGCVAVPLGEGEKTSRRETTTVSELLAIDAPATMTEYRSVDGSGNNIAAFRIGAAETPLRRFASSAYSDGRSTPAGASRPSPRAVSNAVVSQTGTLPNERGASDFLWAWGQFLDHDLDLSNEAHPAESLPIAIPVGDPFFDPMGTGTMTMPLSRSAYLVDEAGVRQQLNSITAWIDASNVYGSDATRANALRALDGTGQLRTSTGDLLPFNTFGLPNANALGARADSLFVAGDVRANEVVPLIVMHTLFLREHNRWVDELATRLPDASEENLYQVARALVGAELQIITYREFLPVLLGPGAMPGYSGYDPSIDASIGNEFATAAYRLGHTLLSASIQRLDAQMQPLAAGPLELRDAFFAPHVVQQFGVEPFLRGLSAQRAQELDPFVVDDLRSFLFGPPGSGGLDLPSLNIQRGRDHGLASYNDTRAALGLPRATSFASISADPEIRARLASIYSTVNDIDLWVGALAEDHVSGGMVGPTLRAMLVRQFDALRAGDRFWYENFLPPAAITMLEQRTLADIIRDNTAIGDEIGENVFLASEGATGTCEETEYVATDTPVAIPDNTSVGAESSIVVRQAGAVRSLEVSMVIRHTWRGDLVASLISPSGTEHIFTSRTGGSADDLVLSDVTIDEVVGENASGRWTLRVRDLAPADVGTIESWSLRVRSDCDLCASESFVTSPTLSVPDNRPAGVTSTLVVSRPGLISSLGLHGFIDHTWRGDLRVSLVSPSGTETVVHNRTGGSQDDLDLARDLSSAFLNEPAAGAWTLRVSDNALVDVGTLEEWGLDIEACPAR